MKYYQVIIYGNGHEIKRYKSIPAESEKKAKETALKLTPDDIAYTTYIHYKELTAKVISSKDI